MSIKVLHVIARMNVGGTARYVSTLMENIPGSFLATGYTQGEEVEDKCTLELNPIRIEHLGRKISPVNDFLSFLELRKIIKEIRPDIVHSHTFKAGLISRLISGKHKKVHTFHGHLFEDNSLPRFAKFFIKIIEKFLASKTDVLISVGEKVGIELRELGIGVSKKWISIPPGVNPLPKIEKSRARKDLGISSSSMLFGWMARVTAVKNPELFLEVARNMPDTDFVMAGGGDLLQIIKANAPKNVQVLGWADASNFWSAVDVAVSTSDNEGMPVALIEAQLAGLPVITTNVGSSAEVVQDQETGIVTSKNPESIISAINLVAGSPAILKSMGEKAIKRSYDLFSVEKMINRHNDAYFYS